MNIADDRRQVALGDQVVENDGDAGTVAGRARAVEEDHERARLRRVVLRRDIQRIVVRRARVELAGLQLEVAGDGSLGTVGRRLRLGAERVILLRAGRGSEDQCNG